MSNLLKPDLVFIVILLVLPGLITQSVFNSLVARGRDKQVDIYQYILHSVIVYVLLYPLIVLLCGVEAINTQSFISLTTKTNWTPLLAVILVGLVSLGWGIIYSKAYRSNIVKTLLGRFADAYEPPNLYASLLNVKYRDDDHLGSTYWITVKEGDYYIVGKVIDAAVENSPREVYLSKVTYVDLEGNVFRELEENVGVIIRIDDVTIVEISEAKSTGDEL